jgi:hydrogenase maturation factor
MILDAAHRGLDAGTVAPERPTPPASGLAGPLRFVRYAFMPNRLRYCGGDDNRTLFEYGVERVVDGGLAPLLRRFTGALPYLQLIARANAIPDPFDARVVEAYWLGNELLERVEVRQLYDALAARFGKQLQGRTRELVLGKAPAGARPHHSFHVFDVHSRVGELENTLETMDHCRVSWAEVVRVEGGELVVRRQPLALQAGKLVLASPRLERIVRQVDGRGFADAARPGDWVSVHWGWACEVLDGRQRTNLERYTRYHLALANQTI